MSASTALAESTSIRLDVASSSNFSVHVHAGHLGLLVLKGRTYCNSRLKGGKRRKPEIELVDAQKEQPIHS
jgi:hypothetical protein